MKLLVVDDHPLILEALALYVAEAEPGWTLLTALSRDDALRVLALHADCDAMLLDLALPGTRGLAFLAELRRDRPRLPIVVLSATHDRATIDGRRVLAGEHDAPRFCGCRAVELLDRLVVQLDPSGRLRARRDPEEHRGDERELHEAVREEAHVQARSPGERRLGRFGGHAR